MCEFCTQHGEGKEWYLTMKNYSQDMLSMGERREHIRSFFQDFEARTANSLSMLNKIQAVPFAPGIVSQVAAHRQKQSHFGQVVPLEDVDRILNEITSVVRIPCVCRSLTTGRKQTRYCYGLGIDPTGLIGEFPDYGENLEWLTQEEARAAIHKLDKEGLVHSVWTFDTPFIGGLCNCDQDCMAYRMQVGAGLMQVFFPAEYIAVVDWDACSGCRLCRGHCPFGAIRYTASQDKCLVDPNLCYGCGVCRAICKKDAIHLERRVRPFRWERRPAQPGRYHVHVSDCEDARNCLACLDACPSQVFVVSPTQNRRAGEYASGWQVQAVLDSRCTNCGACVSACPRQAISVQ
ncbi:MAG: 4Fe-4S binding protein [Chloroflexi bacterium]|nr:4Fe-4S binding protein [Chloroflexota bacterium]